MSTLEEMAQTYVAAFFGEKDDASWTVSEDVMRGLLAVLEKHVRPMLENAYRAGWDVTDSNGRGADVCQAEYAARIIAQLTKQNEPAKHAA